MSGLATDRNLIFAALALQNGLVDRDELLAAMDAWLSAKQRPLGEMLVERGAMPDDDRRLLDALIDRQRQREGRLPAIEEFDLTSSVRMTLGRVDDADVRRALESTLGNTEGPEAPPGERYRVLRPHAKGGLGEIFVAEDTELKREVALKEIQQRHSHNRPSRARFVAEAEITGRLEHPGIVPVYGLGAHDDGRPFYAMRFIRGDNLQAAIEQFHRAPPVDYQSLEFRQLLRRFVDVCNAVAYAHSRGVLHRDIKPGNIMLGKYGETLVVDWGLAKIVGRADVGGEEATLLPASGSGSAPTVAGSALGTPAYMSPEQADGKIAELGPATDVYSLGATLFALLTGRPPVEKADVFSMLDRVQRGDLPAPRSVQRAVPAPLDAICRKAMAHKPADRYGSAQALADDIEHWLGDERVAAWRPPFSWHVRRWVVRHRTLVTAIGSMLLVGVVSLAVATVMLAASEHRERLAKDKAAGDRDRLRFALDAMTSDSAERWLKSRPLSGEQHAFLQKAVQFYAELAADEAPGGAANPSTASANLRLGGMLYRMGQLKACEPAFDKAAEAYRALVAQYPNRSDFRSALANAYLYQAFIRWDTARIAEAEPFLERALTEQSEAVRLDPVEEMWKVELASIYSSAAGYYQDMRKDSKAEAAIRHALELHGSLTASSAKYRWERARLHGRLGDHISGRDPAAAEAELQTSQRLFESVLRDRPSFATESSAYANTLSYLLQLRSETDPKAAIEIAPKVVSAFEALAARHPGDASLNFDVAKALRLAARVYARQGDVERAIEPAQRALALTKEVVARLPDEPDYKDVLATCYLDLALIELQRGDRAAAATHLTAAQAVQAALIQSHPVGAPEYRRTMAMIQYYLAEIELGNGKPEVAKRLVDEALGPIEPLLLAFPVHDWERDLLCRAYSCRARALAEMSLNQESALDWGKALKYAPPAKLAEVHLGRARALLAAGDANAAVKEAAGLTVVEQADPSTVVDAAGICSVASAHDGTGLADAESFSRQAIELLRVAVRRGFNDAPRLQTGKDFDAVRQRGEFRAILDALSERKPK